LQGKYLQHNNEKVLKVDELDVLDLPFVLCVLLCPRSFSSLGGRGQREVGALRIAYLELLTLELLTLELLTFGIAYFGIAYFEIAYFGIAYFGTKESDCLLCGRLAYFEYIFILIK
jgi:hypothetical protein